MIKRLGRYGYFIACSGFPECKNAKGISFGVCPKCKGDITLKRSKRGREFYGCSNYPKCDFVSWDKPIQNPCPKCNGLMVERQIKIKDYLKFVSRKIADIQRKYRKIQKKNSFYSNFSI